ncbi:MAG: FAD-dependent oxidoreductase [Alphaproteobacteria bacterium]|nr:FAD-dependent oxidoreductase [Alphaproteobacteria bacterium]
MSSTVHVVGAGIAGLTAALVLARRGHAVRVWERSDGTGGCTHHGGGMLAPVSELDHGEAWVADLGHDSAARWRALLPDAPREVLATDGLLVVAHRPEWPLLDEHVDRAVRAGHGARVERVDAAGIAAREPLLAGRFHRGLWLAGEGRVDPRRLRRVLLRELDAAGATVRLGVEVDPARDRRRGGPLDGVVVDARGLAAPDLDLRPVRGEYVLLRAPAVTLRHPVRVAHPRYPLYAIPRGEGLVYVGATQVESGHEGPPQARSVLELLSALYGLHPAFAEAEVVELGVGHRPARPDHRPVIAPREGGLALNGLFRHGFLFAPVLAEAVADRLEGRAIDPRVSPFVAEAACAC